MSRYTITLDHGGNSDLGAAIGFDPPLRTFFLQGFIEPEFEIGIPAISLGTVIEEYPTLESLVQAARAHGYEINQLARRHLIEMLQLAGHYYEPRIGERLGIVI